MRAVDVAVESPDRTVARPDIQRFERVAALVGRTPVLDGGTTSGGGGRILVKLEGQNPTGSVKDRACVAMFRRMLADPSWRPQQTVIDASSGSMGCSIAYFGRILGVPVRIVSSSKLTPEKRFFIDYFGARVDIVGTFTIDGNQFCRTEVESDPDSYYFLDQLHNDANPAAHFESTGPEILSQVPTVSAVVGSIGSGGTLLGVGRFLKAVRPDIKVIAIEAASGTRLPGTAALVDGDYRTPFIADGFDEATFDGSIRVGMDEAVETCKSLPELGIFGGIQTAAAICGARRAAQKWGLSGDIVTISGDTGWKNIDALATNVGGAAS